VAVPPSCPTSQAEPTSGSLQQELKEMVRHMSDHVSALKTLTFCVFTVEELTKLSLTGKLLNCQEHKMTALLLDLEKDAMLYSICYVNGVVPMDGYWLYYNHDNHDNRVRIIG
jgi:hypothetical protein